MLYERLSNGLYHQFRGLTYTLTRIQLRDLRDEQGFERVSVKQIWDGAMRLATQRPSFGGSKLRSLLVIVLET